MSLINQMLKDLEQRGAGSTDAEKIMLTRLEAVATADPNLTLSENQVYLKKHISAKKISTAFLKISGLMVLLAGGTYLWVQSNSAQSQSTDISKKNISSIEQQDSTSISTSTPNLLQNIQDNQAIKNNINIEYKPLFELELKHTPVSAQTFINKPENNLQLATYHPQETLLVRPAEPLETIANVEAIDRVEPMAIVKPAVALKKTEVANYNLSISKYISPEQKSANAYRQALTFLQQGRVAEAQENLVLALEVNPANEEARQTLAGLLMENKRNEEARAILAAGLTIAPGQSNFRMAVARLQIEAGDRSGALNTLEQGASFSKNNADYQSFLATLLQRAERHEEAISHYSTALSINSNSASALIGLGISLQAVGKLSQAQEAFTRVQSLTALSPELAQFADQQLKQINQHLQVSAAK